MNVLLTGGAGYIGSHIAVELLDSGHSVIIADDFSNSSPDIPNHITEITGKLLTVCKLDTTDKAGVDKLFYENKPDAVIHLAGFKAVGESVSKPLLYYRNNLDCTLTILEAMEKHRVGKLIFSSSATVYGIPERLPYTEDMKPGVCTNPYGSTKQMIERIITDTALSGWLSAVTLRYFNPVGAHRSGLIGESPRGTPSNLMPLITQIATGKLSELRIYGNDYPTSDGTCVRDYIHVVDLAKGHVKALEYCAKHPGIEVFNLGTGHGISVLELIEVYERVNNVSIPYVMSPRRPGDLPVSFADSTKAEKLLGWKTELTIEDMCRDSFIAAIKSY